MEDAGLRAAGWGVRGNSLRLKADDACAVVDISAGTASLHEAQRQARKAVAPCVIVQLGRRSFQLIEPLVISSADSNTHWIGEGAEITTGYDVPPDAWTHTTANGVAAVHMNASLLVNRSHWGTFTLSNGLEDGHLSMLIKLRDVWRPMTVARWPNVPFDYRDAPPVNWSTVAATDCAPSNGSCLDFTWAATTDRPTRWVKAAAEGRLFLHGFFTALWEDSRGQIQNVDVAARRLRSTVTNPQQMGGVNNESVWYAYGMHEELDTEGEYIVHEDTGMLSAVLPAECVGPDGGVVCETRLLPDIKKLHFQACLIVGHAYLTALNCSMAGMIQVIDAGNITLQGLNLTGSFGSGVTVFGSTNVTIESCAVNNHNEGVVVGTLANTNKTSSNVSLLRSEIGFTRGASSRWTGGNRSALTPSGFLIEQNRFHDFGLYKYVISPGVVAGGVGTVIRKNEFRSALHMAILFGGNDHVIELNDVHHVTTVTYDAGAIYAGRDLSSRGTVIRWNRLHHLDAKAPCDSHTSCAKMAIYMDDWEGGNTVVGNIFYKVQTGFMSNCGGDFNFSNNLFVEAELAIRQIGEDLATAWWAASTAEFLYMLLHLVPFEGAVWVSRYPELAARFSAWTNATQPPLGTTAPLGNTFATNAVVDTATPQAWACQTCPVKANTTQPCWVPGIYPDNWRPNASDGMFSLAFPWTTNATMFDIRPGNVKMANPGFAAPDPGGELNFTLRPDSPLFKLGWQAIPEHEIGP